jgi:superfamily I DNA/RNA helicase
MNIRRRKAIQAVEDDEVLTQYGNKNRPIGGRAFKNRPPFPDQINELSLLSGKQTVAAAAALISTTRDTPSPGSGVRYTTGARLKRAGFFARHTGNNRNPLHVSVMCMDENHNWTDDDGEKFDACFDEPVWGEG